MRRRKGRRYPWTTADRAYFDAIRAVARTQLIAAAARSDAAGSRRNGRRSDAAPANRWPNACLAHGLGHAYRRFHEPADLEAVARFADAIVDAKGGLVCQPTTVGQCMVGSVLIDLFEQTGESRYRRAAEHLVRFLLESHVKTPSGTLPYTPGFPRLVLVDTLPMVCPLLARYGIRFDVPQAIDLSVLQLQEFLDQGMSRRLGLPFHGFQVGGPGELGMVGWTRGTGWLAMALVDTLAVLPAAHETRGELAAATVVLAEAVRRFQIESGLWRWAVPAIGGMIDTSGSAMLGYAIQQAAQMGVLGPEWADVAERVLSGIARLTLADGTVDKAQGECVDVGLYPATTGPAPWAQGPAVALAASVIDRKGTRSETSLAQQVSV